MPKKTNDVSLHPNVKLRVPPHNKEAEQAVLGCVLLDENAAVYIMNELDVNDFYVDAHRKIFEAAQTLFQRNKPLDIVTIVPELEASGRMEAVGGISYLGMITGDIPAVANYKHYVNIVKRTSLLRQLIEAGQKIMEQSFTGDIEFDTLDFAERQIFKLSQKNEKSSLKPIAEPATEAISEIEQLMRDPLNKKGVPTGFAALNKMLNGFQPGDMIVLGARPSQGKTSMGMNFIQAAAFSDARKTDGKVEPYYCAVFSLEMPEVALTKRLLCAIAKVDMEKVNAGKLNHEELQRLVQARAKLAERNNIYIDDSGENTPMDILSKCRRLKREQGHLDLIMVDYLGLMRSGAKQVESRQQEVQEISRMMKLAAKELNVPIVLLCQLSRDVEKRKGMPQMSDLRESGAIEQDADVILFIYRPNIGDSKEKGAEDKNAVQLVVAKHRNGATGVIDLKWVPQWVSFEDADSYSVMAEDSAPPNSGEGGNLKY